MSNLAILIGSNKGAGSVQKLEVLDLGKIIFIITEDTVNHVISFIIQNPERSIIISLLQTRKLLQIKVL